jgi:hypothetical protein
MPVVGFLSAPSPAPYARYVAAVHQGLKEAGFVEGQNVRFEYRWAEGHFFTTELAAKRLELLRELLPTVMRVAVLVNPANAATTEATLREFSL